MVKKNIIYLSLGSNLGNRKSNLKKALKALKKDHVRPIKISSIYETKPVGIKDQPDFLNMAVKAETSLSPHELLEKVLYIEKRLGRVRKIKGGPRTIDIDILLYGDIIINEKDLIIPHPQMYKRDFVLIPLKEIEPGILKNKEFDPV